MTTDLIWTRRAHQDLGHLDRQIAGRMIEAMTRYADTGQGDVRPVTGRPEWCLRVGDWRLLSAARTETRAPGPPATGTIEVRVIEVLRVLPRGRAYRDR